VTGGTFTGPIHVSSAFVAIGVNSLYNFAANHTAFKGAVDEVYLYNYALSDAEIRALYLAPAFRITSITTEGSDLRLAWACVPGASYVVQTNALLTAATFADLTAPIPVPADFSGTTTNYLHSGMLTNSSPLYYRIMLLQ
jgi:hypothetical protein